jgi:hypothetical protein
MKEEIKKYVNGKSKLFRIFYYLRIVDVKAVKENKMSYTKFYVRQLNPWNPLSYIFVIYVTMCAILNFIRTELVSDFFDSFKYK